MLLEFYVCEFFSGGYMLEIMLSTGVKKSGGAVGPGGDTGPGPTTLIGSNATAGFYGEAGNLISGSLLSSKVGLTAGTLVNDTLNWLKFFIDDKIVLIPNVHVRSSLYWQDLYQAGVVYGDGTNGKNPAGAARVQNVRVVINGYTYIVRLIKNTTADPYVDTSTNDPAYTAGSEWNRLLYNIVDASVAKGSQVGANWAHYTENQLAMAGSGSLYSWGMETPSNPSSPARMVRGGVNATFASYGWLTSPYNTVGWRPLLELTSS